MPTSQYGLSTPIHCLPWYWIIPRRWFIIFVAVTNVDLINSKYGFIDATSEGTGSFWGWVSAACISRVKLIPCLQQLLSSIQSRSRAHCPKSWGIVSGHSMVELCSFWTPNVRSLCCVVYSIHRTANEAHFPSIALALCSAFSFSTGFEPCEHSYVCGGGQLHTTKIKAPTCSHYGQPNMPTVFLRVALFATLLGLLAVLGWFIGSRVSELHNFKQDSSPAELPPNVKFWFNLYVSPFCTMPFI